MGLQTPERLARAQAHLKHNRIPAAEAELSSVLADEPGNAFARTMLAALHFKTGRLDQAEDVLTALYELNPRQVDAIGLLAVVRKAKGDFAGAAQLFQRLTEMGQRTVDVYNQLGSCALAMGDAVAAGAAFRSAIELDRNAASSYFNLGLALKLAGRSFETFATFKRAIELNPNLFEAYVELWQQMRQLLNWKEGLPVLEMGMRRFPESAQMEVMLGTAYGKVGQPARAEACYKSALMRDAATGLAYAHWLQEEGRFEESVPLLLASIHENPVQAQPYYNLAVARCFQIDDRPLREVAAPLLRHPAISDEGQMFLHYALAKAFDDDRNFELAMSQYDRANAIAYRLYNGDIAHYQEAVDAEYATMAELYSREQIDRLRPLGSKSTTPIFIVGMIRTGTTLLDQMLSSHRHIASAGEQPFWQVNAGRVNRRLLEAELSASDFRELENWYLHVLRDAAGPAQRITDKMPTNFLHMGLMTAVFPNAKFVHLRRNPVDTCLSIYTTFLGNGTQFAYSQANIVAYYRAYFRIMEHWRSAIPRDRIIEIDYEDLVTNKEAVLRDVLEFCGVGWDDAVLAHERNTSQVSTPSLWTARQPVNAASVQRWRKYEPWLGQLLELSDLAHPPADSRSPSDER